MIKKRKRKNYTVVFSIFELSFVWNQHPRHFTLCSKLDNIILDIIGVFE